VLSVSSCLILEPMDTQNDRYAGRPLLILLENYVLSCIGQLPVDKEAGLLSITQRVFVEVQIGKPRSEPRCSFLNLLTRACDRCGAQTRSEPGGQA
jgi:hypothetical protein